MHVKGSVARRPGEFDTCPILTPEGTMVWIANKLGGLYK